MLDMANVPYAIYKPQDGYMSSANETDFLGMFTRWGEKR